MKLNIPNLNRTKPHFNSTKTPWRFGGDDTVSQHCILNHMLKEDFGIEPKCKKSCSKLEYFGELLLTFPYQSEEKGYENWTVYYIFAIQINQCGFGSQALERISNL